MKRISCFLLAASLLLPCLAACTTDAPEATSTEPSVTTESIPTEEGEFVITEKNHDKLKIVCRDESGEKAKAAAADLQAHLLTMTGWTVPIVEEAPDTDGTYCIIVGENALTKQLGYENERGYPGKESVTVAQKDNFLVLMGNDDGNYTGTQFAVNVLLETLGCGWFAEDELWTIVPKTDKLELAVGEVYRNYTPRFSSRMSRVYSASPALAHRWYQGGDVTLTGHWLYRVVPASEYAEHPEWYALVKGSRDPDGIKYWHFCYSNKEFADRIAEEAIKKFESSPNLVSLTIAANDGWTENWCECADCRALGNASDVMVHFANNVAEKVFAVYPDRRLQIYSYHNTFRPPQNKVKLHEMIELMLCRETNMYKPLDEDFLMPRGVDPISKIVFTQSWRQNALAYIEKTEPTHVSVWDWYCISASAGKTGWKSVPWVQGEVAIRNQALYEELGAKYVFYDHGPSDGYKEPNTAETYVLRWPLWYVAAKAAFDGTPDEKEILGDACGKLFGEASGLMLEYFLLLSDISKNCDAYSNTWVPAKIDEVYGVAERQEIRALIDKILEEAPSCTEDEQKRIRLQLAYWLE